MQNPRMNESSLMNQRNVFPGLCIALMIICLYHIPLRSVAADTAESKTIYTQAEQVGMIVTPEISEASGLASSARDANLFWVINDSGNSATLFAIAVEGQIRARYTIADTPNYDWEDLAGFSLDNQPYLLIADVGDNRAERSGCSLYIVEEPVVPDKPSTETALLPVKWRISFRYPEGPRDCEAVAVDARQKRVLLLSKRDTPPVLYEVPLMPVSGTVMAKPIGPMTTIPPPTLEELDQPYGFSWSRPTAMDLTNDGNRLIVLTYKNAYAFIRQPGQSWPAVITAPPVSIALPHPTTGLLPIREALCVQPRTGTLFITGERPPAPVFRLMPL